MSVNAVQTAQKTLITRVTSLQQNVEQLSEMTKLNQPVVYINKQPIEAAVIRQQCDVVAHQLRDAALELQRVSGLGRTLNEVRQMVALQDGSALADLQKRHEVELAELDVKLESEYFEVRLSLCFELLSFTKMSL